MRTRSSHRCAGRDARRGHGRPAFDGRPARPQPFSSSRRFRAVCGVHRLLVEKFSDGEPTVAAEDGRVVVRLDGERLTLSPEQADALRAALGDALTGRREFLRTAGERRADGSYVVERRGADSSGHCKVFESFDALRRLYRDLPDEFGAADVDRPGVTGGRRHLLVRHFVENPAFGCELAGRQPLTARKRGGDDDGG